MICDCPEGAALENPGNDVCVEDMGQIQKILIQRKNSATGVPNEIDLAATLPTPEELAFWTALIAAVDGTKIIVTPTIHAPVIPATEKREYGGGDATAGGRTINLGASPAKCTGEFLQVKQAIIEVIKKYSCENISFALVGEDGRIWGQTDDNTTPTTFRFINVNKTLFVSDKEAGNREGVDKNMFSYEFDEGWSDKLYAITPSDFDALNDLVNA